MKKKEFKTKLQLHKKTISNLAISQVQGGTNPTIAVATIETIEITIDITIATLKTQHRACTIIATCNCSLHCPTTTREPEKCNTDYC
ncbi:MAG: class I lanthipeptide [Bacteroidota bacterium]